MADDTWRWTDAWIFVAVIIANGAGRHRRSPSSRRPEGIRIADVVATAHHLNHAIPTRSDVELAIRRLAGMNLITVDDGWIQVSPTGAELWRNRPRDGLSAVVDTMHAALARLGPPREAEWHLRDEEHRAAVQEFKLRRALPTPKRSTLERLGRVGYHTP
ncbi:MAG: hypothetical protein DIU79_02335 [Actinobacteria bacterium]|nr:MAG: hypothetical protein DIU79_02335 [Actinomycetota bacterium]